MLETIFSRSQQCARVAPISSFTRLTLPSSLRSRVPVPDSWVDLESSPQTAKPPDLDSSALTTQLLAFLIHSGYQFIHDFKFVRTTLTSKRDTRVARGIMYLPLPYLLRLVVTHTNKKTKISYHLIYSSAARPTPLCSFCSSKLSPTTISCSSCFFFCCCWQWWCA